MEPEDTSLLLILFTSFMMFVVFVGVGKQIDFLVEFSAGILGVVAGFSLARSNERRRDKQTKKDLIRDLHDELEEIKGKLTGKGLLLYPDIWDSAISSGQIRLLESEQLRKLASVYRDVKGTEYEAKRVRDLGETYRLTGVPDRRPRYIYDLWTKASNTHREREKELKEKIEALLKEKWWMQEK